MSGKQAVRLESAADRTRSAISDGASLSVTALPVGHGDATLIEYEAGDERWAGLIDGGTDPDTLRSLLFDARVEHLNVVVATHFDSDHVVGLSGVPGQVDVDEYWAPALPAFERHRWLFGSRATGALERGGETEAAFEDAGVEIIYPFEGFRSSPLPSGSLQIEVLSPPSRLISALATEADMFFYFGQEPAPLGWLLDTEVESEGPDLGTWSSPAEMRSFVRPAPDRPQLPSAMLEGRDVEPEFFGDSGFNNSSIVVRLNARLPGGDRSVLVPGDQENWTYLHAHHSAGLHTHIVKAPHHDGRIYIENDSETADSFFALTRPAAVIFSATGKHKLPRATVRESAARWGATVLCTSQRTLEPILRAPSNDLCCHDAFSCKENRQVRVVADRMGIRSDTLACHSGSGSDPGPAISIRQHIIEPSPVVSKLQDRELDRLVRFVCAEVRKIHNDRKASQPPPGLSRRSPLVGAQEIIDRAATSKARDLEYVIDEVLDAGRKRGKLWFDGRGTDAGMYLLPDEGESKAVVDLVTTHGLLVFTRFPDDSREPRRVLGELMPAHIGVRVEAGLCWPTELFRPVLWPYVIDRIDKRRWRAYVVAGNELWLTASDLPTAIEVATGYWNGPDRRSSPYWEWPRGADALLGDVADSKANLRRDPALVPVSAFDLEARAAVYANPDDVTSLQSSRSRHYLDYVSLEGLEGDVGDPSAPEWLAHVVTRWW